MVNNSNGFATSLSSKSFVPVCLIMFKISSFIPLLVKTIYQCKPISEIGAEQVNEFEYISLILPRCCWIFMLLSLHY